MLESWIRRSWLVSGRACILAWCVAAGSPAVRAQPWWATDLEPGRWQVGFTCEALRDSTRALASHRPRAVQLSLWYPASSAGHIHLRFADYLRLAAAETTAVDTTLGGDRYVHSYGAFLQSRAVPESVVTAWFGAPMLAVRDAPAAARAFPLVLLAQGNGESAADQAVLGEYLASHGYVVATSPSQARITGEPTSDSAVGRAAEDQADDLALLRAALRGRADVAGQGVAVIGHSFGARSALLYAMRDSTVLGVVSLDGGIGTATARVFYESAPSFRASAVRASLLHFYEVLDPVMSPEWGTLRKLERASVWTVPTRAMHHHHFTVLGAASGAYAAVRQATGATEETGAEYARVLDLTRSFLDATLGGDGKAFPPAMRDSVGLRPARLGS